MQSICIVYAKYVHSMCIVYALYVQLIMVSVTTMLDPHMYTMDHVSNPATALGPNFKDLFDTHRAIDLVLNSGTWLCQWLNQWFGGGKQIWISRLPFSRSNNYSKDRRALETEHEKMHADQVQSMGTMRTVQEQRCSSPSMRCLEGDVSASLVAQHQLPTADKRSQVRVTRKKMIWE